MSLACGFESHLPHQVSRSHLGSGDLFVRTLAPKREDAFCILSFLLATLTHDGDGNGGADAALYPPTYILSCNVFPPPFPFQGSHGLSRALEAIAALRQ